MLKKEKNNYIGALYIQSEDNHRQTKEEGDETQQLPDEVINRRAKKHYWP